MVFVTRRSHHRFLSLGNLLRAMKSSPWKWDCWQTIEIICFPVADLDGRYKFSEADYSMLWALAPNIRHALGTADEMIQEVRKALKQRIQAKEN